jgi:Putative zinc-finger
MVEESVQDRHERWEDLLIEVLDGRADKARRAELDDHLAACAECRAAAADYTTLFARLEDAREREPVAFWDRLAAEIDRRVAEEADAVPAQAGPAPSGSRVAPAGRGVIDLSERARFGGGWGGVKGGIIAAGIAILLLVGLYLELPRSTGTPQAFITPPRRAPIDGPVEPTADERLARQDAPEEARTAEGGEEPADAAALTALASGLADGGYGGVASELQDPLADLAEAELALQGLTPEEAEELLRSLESRT